MYKDSGKLFSSGSIFLNSFRKSSNLELERPDAAFNLYKFKVADSFVYFVQLGYRGISASIIFFLYLSSAFVQDALATPSGN
ncbi:hypothetical protein RchiOBHm_Chr5g0020821 [Rosa chinensis]|uniref:Uncharacterized protein n=1 Tax=Rosa chinensis TaxID=74649 RepID=A0A2P6Q7D9_ROSCH|nr:hypothetical protein RchiOBHm_Chr5g0020821 [Rosa chinensis]